MTQIIIDDSELIRVIKKKVGDNGQISIGKEHARKLVTVYIVLVQGSNTRMSTSPQ